MRKTLDEVRKARQPHSNGYPKHVGYGPSTANQTKTFSTVEHAIENVDQIPGQLGDGKGLNYLII